MSKLRRAPETVLSALKESAGGQVVTSVPCKIQIPVRFTEGSVGLGSIGINTFIYGIFAIILESGEYSVCNINAMVQINPYKTTQTTIDNNDYHEFWFNKGDIVIKSTTLLQVADSIYNVFNELVFTGKVPWYMGYEDMGKLFDTASYHGNSNAGKSQETIELIASMIARSKKDRTIYIRETAKSYSDTDIANLDYVPLKSVFYSVKSTMNKLSGSYFNDGVVSALVNPSEQQQKIEGILLS
jgi:hypothetical protein